MASPLEILQRAQGGRFVAGELTAASFGDPAAEYRAASAGAALFDLSDWSHLAITGPDRAEFLHGFCTNDIKRLHPGQGCEAFLTNVKGRIIGHVLVFAGEDSLWLMMVPGEADAALRHLSKYVLTEGVQLHQRTSTWGVLAAIGPHAALWLEERCGVAVDRLERNASVAATVLGTPAVIARFDTTRQPGFLIRVERPRLAAAWEGLTTRGLPPAGRGAWQALRIEAGFPWFGRDLTDDNLAQEAGRTAEAISFQKGCYLGQEPIARIDALGHVNRELRSLTLVTPDVPLAGAILLDGPGDKEIGAVSSAALSYDPPHAVALGMLRSQHLAVGTTVHVRQADGSTAAAYINPRSPLTKGRT